MKTRAKVSKVATAVRIALLTSSPWLAAHGTTLPIPCVSGACGPGVSTFVSAGAASVAQAGSKLTVNQTSENAILNWQSFNISSDGTVQFVQPDTKAVALNEIYDSNPTQIFGALDANGRVFLINQNGIIFGAGTQVNVGGLIASTLQVSPTIATVAGNSAQYTDLLAPQKSGSGDASAFSVATDANGNPVRGNIAVQQGATIQAADGGEIYMFAANVTNLGTIHTPDGQTILAAGDQIYLAQSTSSDLRGMLVEVQGAGMVQNGLASNSGASSPQQLVGQVIAEHGNVSLAALAVNQYGRVSADTSVTANGSIYLEARNGTIKANSDLPGSGGTLVLGQNSDTEVTLDTSDATEPDGIAQPKSTIQMSGSKIDMLQGSTARATSGAIDVNADSSLSATSLTAGLTGTSDGSRFYMAPGAQLDVAGASITLPVTDNVIAVPLYATELADSPIQRNGPLHGQTVYVDIRMHGTNADGTTWWGTPLANVAGEIQGISRNVTERNLTGGTVSIQSQGDVILAPQSKIDLSGGYIQYAGGYTNTSQLLTLWGQTIPIGSADPNVPYAGVVNSTSTTDAKWGVKQTHDTTPSYYAPGYMEGKDAGELDLSATAFILDGSVSASTVVGTYQVKPTTVEPSTDAQWSQSTWIKDSLYRPYNEVPKGATLQIGTPNTGLDGSRVLGDITIASGRVLGGLTNADRTAFDPLTDSLPANFGPSTLQPGIIDAFDHVAIYADGKFIEPTGVSIALPAGGSFAAEANLIDIEGGVDVPAGSITLTARPYASDALQIGALTLGAQASLTATGAWVNESKVLYPSGNPAELYIDGGTVSLSADTPNNLTTAADMQLEPGSLIDVSGGAELTSSGAIVGGHGGNIKIDAATAAVSGLTITSPLPVPQLSLGATLRSFGLYQGGTLSISAPGICISASDCSAGSGSVLWLAPQFFSSGGFSDYGLTADQSGLSVAPGTTIQPAQTNFVLDPGYTSAPNADTLSSITKAGQLPLRDRKPVNVSLALEYPDNSNFDAGTPTDGVTIAANVPSLVLPASVVIATEPGGSITLTSNTRLDVEGTLRAPGGKISLNLTDPTGSLLSYDPSQGIWLGSNATLDASGVAQVYPNSIGVLSGNVLPGGEVTMDAATGYLELLPGSTIDVSGASGLVDVIPLGGGFTHGEQIASSGGSITLFTQHGGVIDATLMGAAGVAGGGANQPAGGSFSLTIDSRGGPTDEPSVVDQLNVSPTLAPTIVAPGSAAPNGLLGRVLLPANALAQGGFGIVALKSYLGGIDFSGGAALSATTEVSLDAESYSVDSGTTANVEAPYVEFGSSSTTYGMTPTSVAPIGSLPVSGGTGVLDVNGGFIELYGTSSLENVGTVSFTSTGDIRVRGVQGTYNFDRAGTYQGGLYADGSIELTAQQIYPTTLTQFTISADDATVTDVSNLTSGSIVVHGSEGPNGDLLSAAGMLTLSAASITQDGVLRAPFGTIALYANSLILGAGSVTSTSANGQTIPFGTTQGGTAWIYSMGVDPFGEPYNAVVYGNGGQSLPAQNVSLNAANIDVQSGATIDLSGGGDLQAYEWTPGTGGTKDVLASSGSYAIVPALHAQVAPYDPVSQSSSGSSPSLGQAVYLSSGAGVPAGTYILLPARYALLPGAYLVTPMPSGAYQDMQPGQTAKGADGGTIVAGYLTTSGLSYAQSRWNGFDVTPASIFTNESQYSVTSANKFFADQGANAASQAAANSASSAMRLPQDGGVLILAAGNSLTLDGTLRTAAQSGAQGAEVDISNPNIVIAADASGVTPSGALLLTTGSLDQLGAQTLLIGGEDGGDGSLATTAQSVTLLDGAALTAPQILLTAQNLISVQSGASITGKGGGPTGGSLSLTGDGALLAVSSGAQPSVTRSGAAGVQGTLDLSDGSTLSAAKGSIYLDATADMVTQGNIAAAGGSLAVRAPAIALGDAPGDFKGAVISQSVLGSGTLANLLLVVDNPQSTGTGGSAAVTPEILLGNGSNVDAQNITLDTPSVTSGLAAGQTAALTASGTLTLGGSVTLPPAGGSVAPPAGGGAGSVVVSAANIALGDNLTEGSGAGGGSNIGQQIDLAGFDSVALHAQGTVTAAYNATLSAHTNVLLTASNITAAAGVTASLEAGYTDPTGVFQPQGTVTLASSNVAATAQSAPPLGGSLTVKGSGIAIDTRIDLPSGNLALLADGPQSGGITLGSTGVIDVAGIVARFGSESVATPGGNVYLSTTGGINLINGSAIDVSAGSGGLGGSLSLSAPKGRVTAQGALTGTGQGASFSVDAADFSFDSLLEVVNANTGAFAGAQSYRLGGTLSGGNTDITLLSGNTLRASDVLLEADNGKVEVDGTVDASGARGGNVTLAAGSAITLNGAIDAHALTQGENGGTVEFDLGQQGSKLAISEGGIIDVSGGGFSQSGEVQGATVTRLGTGGTVLLRVPYANAQWLSGITLAGAIKGASSTGLEVYNVFTPTASDAQGDVVIDASAADLTNPQSLLSQAQQFVGVISGSEAGALAQLAPATDWHLVIQPGVEIDATGSITLNTTWDFNSNAWRASDPTTATQDIPGILTLRAGGSVAINNTLSDGVGVVNSHNFITVDGLGQPSWSYRLVAGADAAQSAADPLAVTGNGADVTVGDATSSGVQVRTGTGFIKIAASQDFVLGNASSVVYTAGEDAGPAPVAGTARSKGYMPDYATGGGNIDIAVGRDVVGAADTTQFVNDWQWRDEGTAASGETGLGWSVNLANFEEGVGALGGGNVTVHAGGDVKDFSASIASIGNPQGVGVNIQNEGHLEVTAGGNINGGTYYVGLGDVTLSAGGSVGASENTGLAPLIGLGDASLNIMATDNVAVTDIVNPTLLNLGQSQRTAFVPFYFQTYGTGSSAALTAIGGNIVLANSPIGSADTLYGKSFLGASMVPAGLNDANTHSAVLDYLPSTLDLYAFGGNTEISRGLTLAPSAQGGAQILANQSISFGDQSGTASYLTIPDFDVTSLPNVADPAQAQAGSLAALAGISDPLYSQTTTLSPHASAPVFGSVTAFDENPVVIVAQNGDITFPSPSGGDAPSGIWSAKPVIVSAGRDLVDLNLVAQNLTAADVTSVSAGRDITYPQVRLPNATISTDGDAIVVAGPGELQLTAGRNIDLGTSSGVTTIGNEQNTVLPSLGAGISVEAGTARSGNSSAQYDAFIKKYVDGSSDFDAQVVNYVEQTTNQTNVNTDAAKLAFDAMPALEQRTFVEELFFELLKTYGEEAVKQNNNADYAGAYAAIDELFPGGNAADASSDPFSGNISLYFSQIYTYSGGNISLLAPGGQIDAGLALPPSGFGISKSPQQLGIVTASTGDVNAFTYSDFQVNQSRVFAADGGNILVWSAQGNIDAGRGSKTSLSASAATVSYDNNGFTTVTYFPPTSGSGIQALADTPGVSPGLVDLFAPHGVVNANEAGIVAGNLIIGATRVLGASNISVSGTALGVPTEVTGLGTQALSGSNSAAGATSSAQSSVAQNSQQEEKKAPEAEAALRWLDVFVLGFGEETCSANDVECLKRQKHTTH